MGWTHAGPTIVVLLLAFLVNFEVLTSAPTGTVRGGCRAPGGIGLPLLLLPAIIAPLGPGMTRVPASWSALILLIGLVIIGMQSAARTAGSMV